MTAGIASASEIDLMDMGPFVDGRQYELYRALRDHDPLHWNSEPDGPGFWSFTRHADVRAGLNDHELYSSADGTQIPDRRVEGKMHSFHNMDEPRHGKLRKVAISYFRAVKIREWHASVQEIVTQLVDEAERAGELEFVHNVSANLPIRVLARVLGVPAEDCPMLAELSNIAHIQDPEYVTTDEQREDARNELFAYFKDLSDKRRAEPKDDLVSVLVHGRVDGEPLTWEDLASYYIILMAAGNETTRHLVSGAIDAFDRFPEEWQRLRAEPGLLRSGIEEMVRWVAPVAYMRRTARRPVEMYGRTIEPGQKVVMWFAAGNRDDRVFTDPDRFVLDRKPNDHLGFGWGVHFCMGAHLARHEATALFTEMVSRGLTPRILDRPHRLEANMFSGIKRMQVSLTRG